MRPPTALGSHRPDPGSTIVTLETHLELRRYLSDNRYQDSPLRVNRYTGEIALGGALLTPIVPTSLVAVVIVAAWRVFAVGA